MSTGRTRDRSWRMSAVTLAIVTMILGAGVSPLYAQESGAMQEETADDGKAEQNVSAPNSGRILIDEADQIVDVDLIICDMLEGKVDSTLELTDEEVAAIRKDVASARLSTGIPNTPAAWHVTVVFELESGRAFSAIPVADGFVVDSCEPCEMKRVDSSGRPKQDLGFVVPKLEDASYWDILRGHLGRPSKEYRVPKDRF